MYAKYFKRMIDFCLSLIGLIVLLPLLLLLMLLGAVFMGGNYWLSCMIIDKDVMCRQVRSEKEALYVSEDGKSCPTEILETLAKYNVEGRPIWKPMHTRHI